MDELSRNWPTIVAMLLSPFIAVSANNFVERFKEKRRERQGLFEVLMLNRMAPLSVERIRALNSIDFVFTGSRKSDKAVREKWKELRNSYNTPPGDAATASNRSEKWNTLTLDLLKTMGDAVGMPFDKVDIERDAYIPQSHVDVEADLNDIRSLLKQVLSGERAIRMNSDMQ